MPGKKQRFIEMSGQKISWSFIQKVRRLCGGDWDQTLDAFWKARSATGENGIMKYIMKGFVLNAAGVRYILLPSPEMNSGRMESIRSWWAGLLAPHQKASAEPVRSALRDALLEMAEKLR